MKNFFLRQAGSVVGDGAMLLLVVISLPLVIILVGAPIALVVRLILALAR